MSDSAIVVVVMLAVVAGLATAVLVREDSAPGVPLISSTGEVEITSEQMATISELADAPDWLALPECAPLGERKFDLETGCAFVGSDKQRRERELWINRRFCLTAPKEIGDWASIPHNDGTETFCERRLTP